MDIGADGMKAAEDIEANAHPDEYNFDFAEMKAAEHVKGDIVHIIDDNDSLFWCGEMG